MPLHGTARALVHHRTTTPIDAGRIGTPFGPAHGTHTLTMSTRRLHADALEALTTGTNTADRCSAEPASFRWQSCRLALLL
jgi:hypothetical protein